MNHAKLRDSPGRKGAILFLLCALLVVTVLLAPSHFIFDDAYRYLVVADNLAAGDGSTFDGISRTNGYHPLWLLFSIPVAVVARSTGLSALSLTLLLQAAMGVGVIALGIRLARQVALPHPSVAFGLLMVFFLGGGLWGSEGWLNGLFQLAGLSLLLDAHESPDRWWRWATAGMVLGLAVLARLDLIFLAASASISAMLSVAHPFPQRLRNASLAGASVLAVASPYLLASFLLTGHFLPVSAAIKSSLPWLGAGRFLSKWGTVGLLAMFGGLAAVGLAVAGTVRGSLRSLLAILGGATLAHAGFVALFLAPGWSTNHDYYYVTGAITLACVASVLFERLMPMLPSYDDAGRGRLGFILAVLLLSSGLLGSVARGHIVRGMKLVRRRPPSAVRLGRWMSSNLPSEARAFTMDSPGRLAWYSSRSVVAADGLSQDRAFGAELTESGLAEWLDAHDVTHVVGLLADYSAPWSESRVRDGQVRWQMYSPFSGRPAGTIELRAEEALMTTAQLGGPQGAPVGIWRWPPD